MTATFGKLQGRSLELGDGLNIIEAPNETGKSTWCAFLTAMLYGINSRERDRAGFIADKNRFAPWSGAAMSGRMDCGTELGELTLTRATRRQTSPMGEFSAVYAGTNEPVPGLTGAACGETLLGISREVFERSAFIRQNNLPISQDAELERRIAALISSGEAITGPGSSPLWRRSWPNWTVSCRRATLWPGSWCRPAPRSKLCPVGRRSYRRN